MKNTSPIKTPRVKYPKSMTPDPRPDSAAPTPVRGGSTPHAMTGRRTRRTPRV